MSKIVGKVRVTVVEAAGLAPKDGRGLNNPYAKIVLGDRKVKTKTEPETNNPVWNESFVLPVYKASDLVEIDLFTSDADGKGEFLGLYRVNVGDLMGQGEVDSWYTLQKRTKKSNVTGKIHLRLVYNTVDKQDAYIDIKSARNVPVKSTLYVKVKFGAGKGRTSNSDPNDDEPDWSSDKPLVLPYDDTEKSIKFYLIDQDKGRAKLGVGQILVADLKMDELNNLYVPIISLKKKDQQVGELHVRISIGDDLETVLAASSSSSAAAGGGKKKKGSKKSKKSKRKRGGGGGGGGGADDDESDSMDGSESLTESGISDDSSDMESSRGGGRARSSSKGNRLSMMRDDGAKWSDEEDEDSIMGGMPLNWKPSGKVLIEVREARNLVGNGGGKKDVIFTASCDHQVFTSHCIRQTQNPVWNEMFSFRVASPQSKIKIGLRDVNETHATMGQVILDVFQFESETVSEWFHIRPASSKSDPVSGDIFVTVTYVPFTDNQYAKATYRNLGIPPSPRGDSAPSDTVVGHLSVLVMQASDLSGKEGQTISSVKVHIDDGIEKVTPVVKGTVNPVWTVGHQFSLPVYKVKNSELRFTVLDNLRAEAPGFLGQGTVALEQLAASEERTMERWFTLQRKLRKAKVTGRLRLRLKLDLPRQKGDASLFATSDTVDDTTKYDLLFKVILVGESGVGKTGLFSRFTTNSFAPGTKATIGSEISCRTYRAEKKIVKVQLWDTAGQERFRAITRQYYRGTMGAILVYDITNKASFDKLRDWVEDVKEYSGNANIQMLLVGNKSDLAAARSVTRFEGQAFAEMNGMIFIETSALEKVNVARAFQSILTDIYDVSLQHGATGVKDVLDDDDPNFKFDASTGKVIVLTPEMQNDGRPQPQTGYCAC
jgi:Ras-related protein Rab-11A